MGLKEKLKKFINVSDEDYIEDTEPAYEDDFDYEPAPSVSRQSQHARTERTTITIPKPKPEMTNAPPKSRVSFAKGRNVIINPP